MSFDLNVFEGLKELGFLSEFYLNRKEAHVWACESHDLNHTLLTNSVMFYHNRSVPLSLIGYLASQ